MHLCKIIYIIFIFCFEVYNTKTLKFILHNCFPSSLVDRPCYWKLNYTVGHWSQKITCANKPVLDCRLQFYIIFCPIDFYDKTTLRNGLYVQYAISNLSFFLKNIFLKIQVSILVISNFHVLQSPVQCEQFVRMEGRLYSSSEYSKLYWLHMDVDAIIL